MSDYTILDMFTGVVPNLKPMPGIIEFAESPEYCGKRLYPKQRTLLKLIFLEEENFTDYDRAVIDDWIEQGKNFDAGAEVFIPDDIYERIRINKALGRKHFREIIDVGGRRGGKGFIGGVIGAYKSWEMVLLDNPQRFFGLDQDKDLYLNVVATSLTQAKKYLYADIAMTILSCKALQPYILKVQEEEIRIQTPHDFRRIASLKGSGIKVNKDIASIRVTANAATSASGRGGAAFTQMFDELAHALETEGNRSANEIYEAFTPSLDQIGQSGLIYVPSSPFCLEPSTRVLTEQLDWVPVGSLGVGDKLFAFDEEHGGGKGNGRCWRSSVVTETSVITAPRYKMTMECGKSVVCTGEHMWLAVNDSQVSRYLWVKTKDLKPGAKIKSIGAEPWEADTSHSAGYLAGFCDADGYANRGTVGITQNRGETLDFVLSELDRRGFEYTETIKSDKCSDIRINGGLPEAMRFLGTVRPQRILKNYVECTYGGRIYGNKRTGTNTEIVASIERVDDGDVVALGTSTSTLIAEGLLSHNTKVGKFHDLYLAAREKNEDGSPKYPEMLVIQHPSWTMYEDYEYDGRFVRAIQQYDEQMQQLEMRNPDKFKVERRARFASTTDAYLSPAMVDRAFANDLKIIDRGVFGRSYRFHADPGKSQDFFAIAGGHVEHWEDGHDHAIIDYINVWQPKDFPPDPVTKVPWVDYQTVTGDIIDLSKRFNIGTLSFDQFNSASSIQTIRSAVQRGQSLNGGMIVKEVTATRNRNWEQFEMFKTALYMGLVHIPDYYVDLAGAGIVNLPSEEMKFLQLRNGRVDHQTAGAITSKDVVDCIVNVVCDLLDNQMRLIMGESATKVSGTAERGYSGNPEFRSAKEQFNQLYSTSQRGKMRP